ncbi:hypothetical protein FRC08_014741 [Ceratobasidium sp. 394]|nr:hypothetical protein FRC08_014741 [Ceratobasidium sp. 394]
MGGSIATGMKKVFNNAGLIPAVRINFAQSAEGEHDILDALLRPLQHLSLCDFISAFGPDSDAQWSSGDKTIEDSHSSVRASFLAVSGSSSRALESLRGMEVHVKALCAAWTEQVTSRFRLSRIEWFRETTRARHEYLIANVASTTSSPNDANGLWLRLERRPKTFERMRDYVPGLAGKFEANDSVTIARRREHLLHRGIEQDEFQTSMSFRESVSLRYILEVLKIIHEESPTYHIAGANCWFFASTVVEVLDSKARAIWDRKSLEWYDHWRSKNWVNYEQYQAIVKRIKRLDIS